MIICIPSFVPAAATQQYTTDWKRAQTVSNQDRSSGVAWTNISNIADSDEATEAVVYTYSSPYTSDWARCTNFEDFGIPAGAQIDGIEMRQKVHRYNPSSGVNETLAIFARKTSGQVGSNIVSGATQFPYTLTWEAWGGSSNKWGATWTQAEVMSADFGFDIAHQGNASDGITYISMVQARITYTV